MTVEEYFKFKADDIKCCCMEERITYSDERTDDFYSEIISVILGLKAVRHSEKLTKKVFDNFVQSFTYWDRSKKELYFIIRWLNQAFKLDPTYYWARVQIAELMKYNLGLSERHKYEYESMSDEQLFELLKAEKEYEATETTNQVKEDHSDLLHSLSKYITGIKEDDFNYFMKHHSLLPETPKAIWSGKKSDAHRFASILKISIPNFNKCFSFPNGGTLKHNDKDKLGKGSEISEILSTYQRK